MQDTLYKIVTGQGTFFTHEAVEDDPGFDSITHYVEARFLAHVNAKLECAQGDLADAMRQLDRAKVTLSQQVEVWQKVDNYARPLTELGKSVSDYVLNSLYERDKLCAILGERPTVEDLYITALGDIKEAKRQIFELKAELFGKDYQITQMKEAPRIAARIAFYEDDPKQAKLLGWNVLPIGEHNLYANDVSTMECIGEVVQNLSGQVFMVSADGSNFNISQHVGKNLYVYKGE